MQKQKIVVFTGAGVSAESGIATFRDKQRLVARPQDRRCNTPEGWHRNPQMVLISTTNAVRRLLGHNLTQPIKLSPS